MLHKTLGEIEQIPETEVMLWLAYAKIRERERKDELGRG